MAHHVYNNSSCFQRASLPASLAHQYFLHWNNKRNKVVGRRRYGRYAYQCSLLWGHTRLKWLAWNLSELELWCEKVRGMRSPVESEQGYNHAYYDSNCLDLPFSGRNSNCPETGAWNLPDCSPLLLHTHSRDLGPVHVWCHKEVLVCTIRNLYPCLRSNCHACFPCVTVLLAHYFAGWERIRSCNRYKHHVYS